MNDTITSQTGFRVRRLTPNEAWRLMGFADEDFQKARAALNDTFYNGRDRSGTQLYKQAGNSIVVDVLVAIMRNLYDAMPYLFEDITVGSFFSGIGAFEKSLTTFDSPSVSKPQTSSVVENDLHRLGSVDANYGLGSRIYDADAIACTLNANGGGGGVKTGWYRIPNREMNFERSDPDAGFPETPQSKSHPPDPQG